MSHGIITVSKDRIIVTADMDGGQSSIDLDFNVESLVYAAGVLARWMDVPYEDLAKEVKRIHSNDQSEAFLNEIIQDANDQDQNNREH